MRDGGFRRIPVLDEGSLVGILSERDLRMAMNSPVVVHERTQDDFLLDSVRVGSCMTTEVITVTPEDTLLHAARLLKHYKIGGLPVLDQGNLVGILTESDLLAYLVECLETGALL